MPSVIARDVSPRPYLWVPERAANFPDTWRCIERHRNPALPMPTAMILAIFFEETGCCNTVQTPPYAIGPGQIQVADFWPKHFFAGQNPKGEWKDNFMGDRWDSSRTTWAVNTFTGKRVLNPQPVRPGLKPLTQEMIFSSYEFGVKMHCKMFEWNWRGHGNGVPQASQNALLGMQLSGQTESLKNAAKIAFINGARRIEALMNEKLALNFRQDGSLEPTFYVNRRRDFANALNDIRRPIKGNPIGYDSYRRYWEYFLPDGFLENPFGYIRLGF